MNKSEILKIAKDRLDRISCIKDIDCEGCILLGDDNRHKRVLILTSPQKEGYEVSYKDIAFKIEEKFTVSKNIFDEEYKAISTFLQENRYRFR